MHAAAERELWITSSARNLRLPYRFGLDSTQKDTDAVCCRHTCANVNRPHALISQPKPICIRTRDLHVHHLQKLGTLEQQQEDGVCNALIVPRSFMPALFKVPE